MVSTDPYYALIVRTLPGFSKVMYAALGREKLRGLHSITVRVPDGEGADTEVEIDCDFTRPENLEPVDRLLLPSLRMLLKEAERLNMTGMTQLFARPQLQYALEHGVTPHSFVEITGILFPPEPKAGAVVLTFPRRQPAGP